MITFLVVAAVAVICIKIISRILRTVIVIGLALAVAWYVTGGASDPAAPEPARGPPAAAVPAH